MIVDLQRRNEELNLKIQRMCEAALNGNEEEINNYDRYRSYRKPCLVLGELMAAVSCHLRNAPAWVQLLEE